MSSQYLCPKCNMNFDDQTAMCEDWRLPEKKFGCPHCKTFFSKQLSPELNRIHPYFLVSSVLFILLMLWPEFIRQIPYLDIGIALNSMIAMNWQAFHFWKIRKSIHLLSPYE